MIRPYRPGTGKAQAHGTKAERRLSKRLDARLTPASGALQGAKGDMVRGEWRIESKSTVKDSYRLTLETLCKASDEATEQGEVPAVAVQFVTRDGRLRRSGGWVVVPEYVFRELIEVDV
jgi:hypothetical protein